MDEKQRPNRGTFTFAMPSPKSFLKCAKCSRLHDGTGSKKWIAKTQLMLCKHCADERDAARLQRQATW